MADVAVADVGVVDDTTVSVEGLIAQHCQSPSAEIMQQIIAALYSNIRWIATQTHKNIPPPTSNVLSLDDLMQIGAVAVIASVYTFDGSKGNKFWTYAQMRVKGAMLDEIRSVSSTSRYRNVNMVSLEETLDNQVWDYSVLLEDSMSDEAHAAILSLPLKDQALILLLINGFSVRTIGRMLEMKLPDVKEKRERVVGEFIRILSEMRV